MIAIDSGAIVCAIVAVGMSIAFLVAEYRSVTTRFLSLFLSAVGVSILLNVMFVRPFAPGALPWPSHFAPIVTGIALISGAEWILRIRRTVPAGRLNVRWGDAMFRITQTMGVVYAVVGVLFNDWRGEYFISSFQRSGAFAEWQFWLFAAPLGLGLLCLMEGTLVTLRRKPDRPEAVRLAGIALSTPLVASGLVLPAPMAAFGSAAGQMIFLIAAVQYHVLQGQRGQFLRRFLAPSVADLVRERGLESAMQHRKLEISVVAVDLRGYTAYAEAHDSTQVIEMLDAFYDTVGRVARRFEATIKDYAGDGVLLLLGAPIPMPDHAERALAFAQALRVETAELFAARGAELGLGTGIASGDVSVGVIGRHRLEYVAVGVAINLAARLCQQAGDGEILIDPYTRERIADASRLTSAPAVSLKGIRGTIQPWVLQPG